MGRTNLNLKSLLFSLLALLIAIGCTTTENHLTSGKKASKAGGQKNQLVTPKQIFNEIRVVKRFIPRGRHGRKYIRPMKPRYITVHSTQNYSGDAWDHARALQRGKLKAPKRRNGNRIG